MFLDTSKQKDYQFVVNRDLNFKFDEELKNIIDGISIYEAIDDDKYIRLKIRAQKYIKIQNQIPPIQEKRDIDENNFEKNKNQQQRLKVTREQKVEQFQLKKGLKLPLIKLDKNEDGDIQNYQYIGNADFSYKKMIFIGERDAGKTKLLNAFVNYYFGITAEDGQRVFVANQEQTTQISHYYLEPFNNRQFGINLIDTPGPYGSSDEQTIKIVSDFINREKQLIDVIIVCIKATEQRLTVETRSTLQSIVKLLGKEYKDYAHKINIARTFYPGGQPDNAIFTQNESPFVEIAKSLSNDWHLYFNSNSIDKKAFSQVDKFLFDTNTQNFRKIEQKLFSQQQKTQGNIKSINKQS